MGKNTEREREGEREREQEREKREVFCLSFVQKQVFLLRALLAAKKTGDWPTLDANDKALKKNLGIGSRHMASNLDIDHMRSDVGAAKKCKATRRTLKMHSAKKHCSNSAGLDNWLVGRSTSLNKLAKLRQTLDAQKFCEWRKANIMNIMTADCQDVPWVWGGRAVKPKPEENS